MTTTLIRDTQQDEGHTQWTHWVDLINKIGSKAFLYGESVLVRFDLALVNPPVVFIATTEPFTGNAPIATDIQHVEAPPVIIEKDGIRSTTVATALIDCKGRVPTARLRDATYVARQRELITAAEQQSILELLPISQ